MIFLDILSFREDSAGERNLYRFTSSQGGKMATKQVEKDNPCLPAKKDAATKSDRFMIHLPSLPVYLYLKQNGLDHTAIWISENDSHSNSIRHRFPAEELFAQLSNAGLLQPAL